MCAVAGAELEGTALVVHYSPVRGYPPQIDDRMVFGPHGDVAMVNAVGRFLRLLRAGRVRAPDNPYALYNDLDTALELALRCLGARVELKVQRRFDRALTVWTESGVEKIGGVLDCQEDGDALAVRRRGSQSLLRIPRKSLIRYELATREYLEVVGVERPGQMQLP